MQIVDMNYERKDTKFIVFLVLIMSEIFVFIGV